MAMDVSCRIYNIAGGYININPVTPYAYARTCRVFFFLCATIYIPRDRVIQMYMR